MHRGVTTFVVAGLVALWACMKPADASPRPSRAQTMVAYAALPVLLCLELDAMGWGRLMRGQERLVIHVQHDVVLRPPAPTLTATIVARDEARRDLEPFSLQPDVGSSPAAQHFGFDVRSRLPPRKGNEPLCIEIGLFPGEQLERLKGVKVRLRAATQSVAQ